MAEVFGAVASGIGIAGVAAQAVDGIRKLQAFCNDIRDAPEEIKYLTTELEILLGTIASIEAQIQRNSTLCGNMDPTPALRFVDQSVRSLNAVIEKLNGEIAQKRMMGSMKMAWKKKVLESHLMKIERSKTSLSLAVSAYSTELYLQTATRTDTKIDQMSMDVKILANSSQTQLVSKPNTQMNDAQRDGKAEALNCDLYPIVLTDTALLARAALIAGKCMPSGSKLDLEFKTDKQQYSTDSKMGPRFYTKLLILQRVMIERPSSASPVT
ncbi:hypothetical protein KCU73_g4862, partial [Aureobasidium melanogenum]